MSYLIYFAIAGFTYLIIVSVLWSISFILLSRFIKNLYLLVIISLIPSIILILYVGSVLENLILSGADTTMLLPFIVIYLCVFALILKSTLFKKLPGPIIKQVLPENTKYWNLETGSNVAYWFYAAKEKKKDYPIVYVHGGPGAHVRNIDRDYFKSFSNEGYDVYLYDQSGGGFSDYLNVTEYSMDRFIDDLECIRKNINADQMILVGQSFGARICSHYAATYEKRVESIIYAGPAGLQSTTLRQDIKNSKELENSEIEFASSAIDKFKPSFQEIIRFSFTVLMCKLGGEIIVDQIISQKEITEYATRMIPEAIGRAYHKKFAHLVPTITSGGINVIVNVLMHNNYNKISSDMINKLSTSDIPVLILRSAYDYVPWTDTRYYKDVFKNHYLVYISDSGHVAWSVNKNDTMNSMINFINGNTNKLICYNDDKNPLFER